MKRTHLVIATALVAAVALAAPAEAQRAGGRAGARGSGGRPAGPSAGVAAPRGPAQPPAVRGRAAPRSGVPYFNGRYFNGRYYGGGYFAPYGRFYRPGLSLGIYSGFGYPYWGWYPGFYGLYGYPWSYGYGYGYGYGYPLGYGGYYGYGGYGSGGYGYGGTGVGVYGGVRISDAPKDAEVWVDGYYAGVVNDFDGTFQRLNLEPGAHRVELRAPGFETLSFEVNVQPGQTINYRARMRQAEP